MHMACMAESKQLGITAWSGHFCLANDPGDAQDLTIAETVEAVLLGWLFFCCGLTKKKGRFSLDG